MMKLPSTRSVIRKQKVKRGKNNWLQMKFMTTQVSGVYKKYQSQINQ